MVAIFDCLIGALVGAAVAYFAGIESEGVTSLLIMGGGLFGGIVSIAKGG
jgi:hypothetical protein